MASSSADLAQLALKMGRLQASLAGGGLGHGGACARTQLARRPVRATRDDGPPSAPTRDHGADLLTCRAPRSLSTAAVDAGGAAYDDAEYGAAPGDDEGDDGAAPDGGGGDGPRKAFGEMKIWVGTWNMGAADPFVSLDLDNDEHYAEVSRAARRSRAEMAAAVRGPPRGGGGQQQQQQQQHVPILPSRPLSPCPLHA